MLVATIPLNMPSPQFSAAPTIRARPDGDRDDLLTLLELARPFLRGELELVDPKLPDMMAFLRTTGAGECWHKFGSFLDHLLALYRILKLWRFPDDVCRCALFHSSYSHTTAELALFEPNVGRDTVEGIIGSRAERYVLLFFSIGRLPLVRDHLLSQYPQDSELLDHLKAAEISLRVAKENQVFDPEEPWRKKINFLLPPEGVIVKHRYTEADVKVSRRFVVVYLMMVMADFSEQLFGFQDELFENYNGLSEFVGENIISALWPGDGKPGLWMHFISRLGVLCSIITKEEEIFMEQKKYSKGSVIDREDEDLELVIPPVFSKCTQIVGLKDQNEATDLYWEAVCGAAASNAKGVSYLDRAAKVEELFTKSIEKNPFVGEPHVMLGQVYLGLGRFEEAEKEIERGLRLLLEWASPWDKRMPWDGWVSWARVLLAKAKERSWPDFAFGVFRLGLIREP